MASPFPGMNPFLEQPDVWHNFHQQFCAKCLDALVPQVRPTYFVKLDENVYIHELGEEQRLLLGRPVLSVAASGEEKTLKASSAGVVAPVHCRIPAAVDVEREAFIEICDSRSRRVITVIELLSPANKATGGDREQYIAKRRQLLRSEVHFIEIDLLRGGTRMPIEDLPDSDYCVVVSRASERPEVGVWPIKLSERLPAIPVPLRTEDSDATLDLQAILDEVYDLGGFADYIYDGLPQPPLHPEDNLWARQRIPMG